MARSRPIPFLLLAASLVATASFGAVSPQEREALMALYSATGGSDWLDSAGWGGSIGTECSWYGVNCDASGTTVVRLLLPANNLEGTIPPEIGNLTSLFELDLSSNLLGGVIPPQIGQLAGLQAFRVNDNALSLPLPETMFSLPVEELDLSGNRFDGPFPSGLGAMTGLRALRISHNALRGEVPPTLTDLVHLIDGFLNLSYNALTATEPTVRSFIDVKHGGADWTATQTVPPTDVSSNFDGLTWTPIEYTADRGTYRVFVDHREGGPAGIFTAASKSSSSLLLGVADVAGELVATIRTVTEPHGRQKNVLVSEPSLQHAFTQFGNIVDFPAFAIGVPPEPLVQIGGIPQNATFFTVVNYGGFGGDAMLDREGEFFTISESSFFIDAFETRRIDVSSITQPPGDYEGRVLLSGDGTFNSIPVPVSLVSLPAPPDAEGKPQRTRLDVVSGRSPMLASATFRNDGADVLSGVVESDVNWIVPITRSVEIAPGQTAVIEYEIDPSKRPDRFSEEGVSFSGALRLVYPDEIDAAAKGPGTASSHTIEVSTTLATVVSTIPPEVVAADIPPFAAGERGYFVPGMRDGEDVFTDVSIANSFGSATVGDLHAFFAELEGATKLRAMFPELDRRAAFLLGAPVRTVFERTGKTGSMQLRSADANAVLVSARLVADPGGTGLLGTALPVFESSRLAVPGSSVVLTGLSGATSATLLVQSGGEGAAAVSVETFDATGELIASHGQVSVDGWETVELADFLPDGGVTVVVRNEAGSSSPVAAYALLHDSSTGDHWVSVDWSSYWGEPRSAPLLIPVARHSGTSEVSSGRRRSVARPDSEEAARSAVHVTLHNAGAEGAAARLVFRPADGVESTKLVRLEPRETLTMNDVLSSLFDRSGVSEGHIRVVPVRGEIAASARFVKTGANARTVGSTIPLYPRGAGMRLGERRSVAALEDSRLETAGRKIPGTWQTRISLLETDGSPTTVLMTMRVATGQSLAVATVRREVELQANELLRLGTLAQAIMGNEREIGVGDLHDLQLDLKVIDGDGAVVIVTEMVENASGDSIIRFD